MKKTNQLLLLIFSVLLVAMFVSCPGATGVMYSLTLNSLDATEPGTKVLYYSSIEQTWYGDVQASQKATKIEIPKKEYTVNFESPALESQKFIQKFNGYYVGGNAVIDENGNILNNLKLTKSMTANASWEVIQSVILPRVDAGDNKEFVGWLERGSAESSAKKPGEEYIPNTPTTTLTGLTKDLNQHKITLNPGSEVLEENRGTTEVCYNAYTKKFYASESADPKNPGDAINRIQPPVLKRTIKYIPNPSGAEDITVQPLADVVYTADFSGYGDFITKEGWINDIAFTSDRTFDAGWSNTKTVKLEAIQNDGYTFLGWQEADGHVVEVGSIEFQSYTPKLENNELRAVWASGKIYSLNLLSEGGTQTHGVDQIFFKVDASGRGGEWFDSYESISSSTPIESIQIPENQFTVKLDLQNGEFVPPAEGEEQNQLTNEMKVNYVFNGYFVSENAKKSMIVNPNGEFKDENNNKTAIYSEKTANAEWGSVAVNLPLGDAVRRLGYTLSGWKNAEGNICDNPYTPSKKDETVFAFWTPNVYTLSLNLQDGEYTSRGDSAVYYCTEDRWYSDKEKTKDANWTITVPQRKYTVSYDCVYKDVEALKPSVAEYGFRGYFDENDVCYVDGNGKILSKSIISEDVSTPVEVNGRWEVPSLDLPHPVKNGYTFVGWREGEAETSPVIPLGEKYNPISDITLYAVWEKTVYNANIEYQDGCDSTSIFGVENIYLNNGEGAVITINLENGGIFSDSLDNNKVKSWFIYDEDSMPNTFAQHLINSDIYIKKGGRGYNYVTVVIKGLIDLLKKEETVTYYTNVVIPKGDIKDNDTGDVTIRMNYKVAAVSSAAFTEEESFVGTVARPVMGSVTSRLGDSLTGVPLRIDLTNAYFKQNLTSSDVEAWFKPLSDEIGNNIKYRIEDGGSGASYVKILISGIPSNERRGYKQISIPFTDLKGGITDSTKSHNINVYYDTKYFLPVFEINLTSSEQDKSYESWANGTVQDQAMTFISLKGEQDWPVVWQKPSSSTSVSPSEKATVKSDFAIADTEVSAGFFMTVYKWAINNGYRFDNTIPYYLGYKNADSSSKDSALDPITGISWYNAVVFCNAATEWYNATKNPGEQLTCAYKIGGTGAGEIIRDATNISELDKIDPKQHLSGGTRTYSHVGDSTGFRLPTRTEWSYAASVSPVKLNETTDLTYSGIALPETFFGSSYGTISGAHDALLQSSSEYLLSYSVYAAPEFVSSDDYGTQYIGKYNAARPYRAESKANDIGLYDMCGNVFEWAEDMESVGYRYVNGGAWNVNGLDYTIASFDRSAPTLVNSSSQTVNNKNTGFRLCRNIR